MLLAIDAGNSFVKWAYHDGRTWLAAQCAALTPFCLDPAHYLQISPSYVVIANVAGSRFETAFKAAFPDMRAQWVQAARAACGVINHYECAETLGADRWAALIGARAITHEPCVVVSGGTALTVDLLAQDGHFLGGAIAPGFHLMRDVLATRTAALQPAAGRVTPWPVNTADAVHTGLMYAVLGVIEKMARVLEVHAQQPVTCMLTGGAALQIVPYLNRPHQLVDNLVLEGLLLLAQKENQP